jgi:hypothetical protein
MTQQIIRAAFTEQERQHRLAQLDFPTVERVGTQPQIIVLRRKGLKIGVGFTLDVAIADAESNLHSYIKAIDTKKKQIVCRKG